MTKCETIDKGFNFVIIEFIKSAKKDNIKKSIHYKINANENRLFVIGLASVAKKIFKKVYC